MSLDFPLRSLLEASAAEDMIGRLLACSGSKSSLVGVLSKKLPADSKNNNVIAIQRNPAIGKDLTDVNLEEDDSIDWAGRGLEWLVGCLVSAWIRTVRLAPRLCSDL